ncbi:cytochrome c4 [Limnohabitans sp. Rim8]|jgi:cytochrome c553|uniref:Cytochrome c4 n=1 Tax=Limnohabitans curvus TaxID=323423 RepID=A0A315EPP0_9BURK|nr:MULTISPECIES: c-type cytochrome [Limnohabitans]PUE58735.1 cytochrome c4 [Limnohabitans curvus]PUE61883.1 cytochrome c4 [Limnohabitans sp. Rim8]
MKKIVSIAFALTVSAVSSLAFAQDIKGDANAGEKKIAMCIGCHGIVGYQASFPEVYKVPKISGQNEKYITTVLNAYKKGERKHPTMRGIADSLSDQDMADISAYYANHGKVEGASLPDKAKEPNAKVAALLTKGACASCHGENFAKPIDPSYPKIAGQNADYLFVALKSYKVEGAATWGRSNGVMGGVAKQFSNAELKELANYMAAQQGDLKTVPQSKFR